MTLQEFYDKTVEHLRGMKEKSGHWESSTDLDGMPKTRFVCDYRSSNGAKCAIGVHIPDEKYDESFEGKSCDALAIWQTTGLPYEDSGSTLYVTGPFVRLALRLQGIHDRFPMEQWEEELKRSANESDFGIVYKEKSV